MNGRNTKQAVAIAAAALAVTAGGALVGNGSAAAPGAGASPRPAAEGWPAASSSSARQVVREARTSAHEDGGSVLRVTEVVKRFRFLDLGAPGDSPGDAILFESRLLDARGERVGRDSVQCTVRIRTYACEASFQLFGRGKIVATDVFFGNEPQVAITGGTGDFADAGGQLIPVDGPDDTSTLVFRLTD